MANIGGTLMENNNRYYPNAYYKIGDLFFTTNKENPSIRFGGSWELFGKGKTLVCVDEEDSDFNEVKKTGGEKTHKLTFNEMPKHTHRNYVYNSTSYGLYTASSNGTNPINYTAVPTDSAGEDQPHNNIQPYITCYIWIRVK